MAHWYALVDSSLWYPSTVNCVNRNYVVKSIVTMQVSSSITYTLVVETIDAMHSL